MWRHHLLAGKFLRIFSLPRSVIFMHIAVDSSAGTICLYLSKFSDTTPNPPMTIGMTEHSQSHIRPSSCLRPPYLVIFSCSFSDTLMSFGQETSMIKHFLFFLSLTTISGRLNTCGLSVVSGVSYSISTSFSIVISGGLWTCHFLQVCIL